MDANIFHAPKISDAPIFYQAPMFLDAPMFLYIFFGAYIFVCANNFNWRKCFEIFRLRLIIVVMTMYCVS